MTFRSMPSEARQDAAGQGVASFRDLALPTNFIFHRLTLFVPVIEASAHHSTVTDFARLRGLSTSVPLTRAAW